MLDPSLFGSMPPRMDRSSASTGGAGRGVLDSFGHHECKKLLFLALGKMKDKKHPPPPSLLQDEGLHLQSKYYCVFNSLPPSPGREVCVHLCCLA